MTQLKTRIPLRLPKRLHGRDSEMGQLLTAFERVSDNHPEVVFIAGEPGMGKTVLVERLRKPVRDISGFFISGKFEQNARHKPLSALLDALDSLAEQILNIEDSDQRNAWAQRILRRLGDNAGVLTQLVPGMQAVIGEQAPPSELEPEPARIRLQTVVLNTLRAISDGQRTLVIFLDDLQWADATTLELERILVTEEQSRILLIGTYRSNEVGPEHPLTRILEDQRLGHSNRRLPLTEISLEPLKGFDLQSLLVDILDASRSEARQLALICQDRTGGNPFYVLQFLLSIQDHDLLRFDRDSRRWCWDEPAILGLPATVNIVELLAGRINGLGEHLRTPMGEAACFGSRFPLLQLAAICSHESRNAFASAIQQLLEEGFLVPQSDLRTELEGRLLPSVCRFAHDRIEEAAYSTLAEQEKLQTHLRIGWILAEAATGLQRDTFLLDAAGQLLIAQSLLDSPKTRLRGAGIMLDAARIARRMTAWNEVHRYAMAGRELLTSSGWLDRPERMTALTQLALESGYFSGARTSLDALLEECVGNAPDALKKAECYRIRTGQMIMDAEWDNAIRLGLSALHTCFSSISANPEISDSSLQALEREVQEELDRLGDDSISMLPSNDDPKGLFLFRTLPLVTFAAFPSGNLKMRSYLCLTGMRIALRRGICTQAFCTLGAYAAMLSTRGMFREAGQLARQINADERLQKSDPLYAHGVNVLVHRALHFSEPFEPAIALLAKGQAAGMAAGDPFIAAICLSNSVPLTLCAGKPLSRVAELVEELIQFCQQWRFPLVQDNTMIFSKYVNTLRSSSPLNPITDWQFNSSDPDHSVLTMFWVNQFRLQASFWLDRADAIEACIEDAHTTLPVMMGFPQSVEYYFIEYLHGTAHAGSIDPQRLETGRLAIREAAQSCEDNYGALFQIVEAVRTSHEGDTEAATRHLRHAIMLCSTTRNLPYQALATEMLAGLQQRPGVAAGTLQEAARLYQAWGCPARADRLTNGEH